MKKRKLLEKLRIYFSIFILLVLPSLAFAQSKNVTGIVIGDDGQPAIGVTVVEKGTQNGTITDANGNFSIQLKKETSSTLSFSMIGMLSQEETVKEGANIRVLLKSDNHLLNQVVVTGYTSEKKADITGAVSVVDVKALTKVPGNNPMKALQGQVAGVQITSDGDPSGYATVRIRGIGTLNDNNPLYIIDGVPTKEGLETLNPNDIASMQVLKDAAAASIYGSRAANGVIIITTKAGKKGKMNINFDAGVTSSNYTTKMKMLNANQYGQVMWQSAINAGTDPNANTTGYTFDWGHDPKGNAQLNKIILPQYVDPLRTMRTSDTDWFDEITKTGIMQNYNMSASNGTERGNYYFSLGYMKNDGIIKNSSYNRFSARMNSSYKLIDGILTVGENFMLTNSHAVAAPGGILNVALQALPIIPVFTEDGGWGGPIGSMNDRQNPVRLVESVKDNKDSYWRTFGNAFISLTPMKGLDIRSNFGLDYGNYERRDLVRKYTSGKLTSDLNSVNMIQSHSLKWSWNAIASYKKEIGKNHIDAMLGTEANSERDINFNAYREGFVIETPEYMWPDMGTGKSISSGNSTGYTLLSYFAKVNYAYNDRYLASATVRYDGSSRFGKNNRFGTFPAFSLGWRISQEDFMKNVKPVSDLKLRLGWGQTGNQEISNTAIYNIYVPNYGDADPTWNTIESTSYDISGKGSGQLPSGFMRTQIANDNLKWEATTQTNLGLDFGLFQQSLYGSAEYFLKKTTDILINPPYLAAIGEGGNEWQNGASMQNWGLEFSLGYRNHLPCGLQYDITANLSMYRNKVTYVPDDLLGAYPGNGGTDNIIGRPLNSFYGYVADGLFKTQDEVNNSAVQDGKGLGRIRYKDIDGDGKITDADRTWIGVGDPDLMYGVNFNLSYKGFDFTMFWQGIYNVNVVNEQKYSTDFWSVAETGSNKGARLLDAWSPTNMNSSIPAIAATDANNEARFSTYYVENGSYLKLRTLQLGYTLSERLTQKIAAQKIRFYLTGQNLLTIKSSSFTGVDPESPAYGYPIPMTFTAGVNISF